jgi:Ca2+-binding RTX toxin-like protein
VAAGAVQLTLDGGDESDVLIGGDGDDILRGGAGDDVLIGSPGNDAFDGGDGDNIVIQLDGSDTVASATVADRAWAAKSVRIKNGKTKVNAGGKEHTLPRADLSHLTQDVPTP